MPPAASSKTTTLLRLARKGPVRARDLDDAGTDLRGTPVLKAMSRHPKTIGPEKLAVEAAHLMEEHKISALVVVDAEQRVVGALNIHDLLRARVV